MIDKISFRYPYGSHCLSGYGPSIHAVDNNTEKSYCGRNASTWLKMDDGTVEEPTCEKCRIRFYKEQS